MAGTTPNRDAVQLIRIEAEKRYGKPDGAERDVQVALSLGFKAGAKWAWKEALREPADAIAAEEGQPENIYGMDRTEDIVRALTAGVTDKEMGGDES